MADVFQEGFRDPGVPHVPGVDRFDPVAAEPGRREPLLQRLTTHSGRVIRWKAIGLGKVNAAKHRYTPEVIVFLGMFVVRHGASWAGATAPPTMCCHLYSELAPKRPGH